MSNHGATKQSDVWNLETTDPWKVYYSSYLGNGYVGIQVSNDGMGISDVEKIYQSKPKVPVASYVAGLYEGGPEKLIAVPRWSHVNFSNGERWLSFDQPDEIKGYRQTLNMREALFRTSYTWEASGRRTDLEITFFISRSDAHLAVLRFAFTPFYDGEVCLEHGFVVDTPARFTLADRGADAGILWLSVSGAGSAVQIAQALALRAEGSIAVDRETRDSDDMSISELARVRVQSGRRYVFHKYAAFFTSYDVDDPLPRARAKAEEAGNRGFDRLRQEHVDGWAELWKGDIVVDDPRWQRRIHSAMYHLFSSIREGQEHSIPPLGLSHDGWGGRIFWDAEWFMFPALVLLQPTLARGLVGYRSRTLEAARANASLGGFDGAAYAGSTGRSGKGGSAYRPGGMEKQIHITGDVAWAQWQYYRATRDRAYLAAHASHIILDAARFWESRATYNEKADRYEIRGVVPPDESITNPGGPKTVENSAFTNAIARWNIRAAIKVSEILGLEYPAKWKEIEQKMYMPIDTERGILLEYDGYPGHEIKQPDVMMIYHMLYPLEHPSKEEGMEANFDYYKTRADRKLGHSFFPSVHPIIACRLGRPQEAYELFREWDGFFLPPFETMRECIANEYRVFLTSMGGFLQNFLSGFAGIEIGDQELIVQPALPDEIPRITFERIWYGGEPYRLSVEKRQGKVSHQLTREGRNQK